MNEILIPNARFYADRHQLELAESLGSGKDGIVLVAKHKVKPANVAIKVLRWDELYQREKQVYERLRELEVKIVEGFNVPQLIGYNDELRVLEMTIVKRPFVLDLPVPTSTRVRISGGCLGRLGGGFAREVRHPLARGPTHPGRVRRIRDLFAGRLAEQHRVYTVRAGTVGFGVQLRWCDKL